MNRSADEVGTKAVALPLKKRPRYSAEGPAVELAPETTKPPVTTTIPETKKDVAADPSSLKKSSEKESKGSPFFFYTDHSKEEDDDPLTPLTPMSRVPNFPAKMHAILARSDLTDVIKWMPHGRSWKILKPREFEVRVLPTYFDHSKFSSFIRQANGWGFRRVTQGVDRNSYYNELFLRGLPHLCKKMRRPGVSEKMAVNPDHEPNFYEISKLHPVPEKSLTDDDSILLEFTVNQGPKARMPVHGGLVPPKKSDMKSTTSDDRKLASVDIKSTTEDASAVVPPFKSCATPVLKSCASGPKVETTKKTILGGGGGATAELATPLKASMSDFLQRAASEHTMGAAFPSLELPSAAASVTAGASSASRPNVALDLAKVMQLQLQQQQQQQHQQLLLENLSHRMLLRQQQQQQGSQGAFSSLSAAAGAGGGLDNLAAIGKLSALARSPQDAAVAAAAAGTTPSMFSNSSVESAAAACELLRRSRDQKAEAVLRHAAAELERNEAMHAQLQFALNSFGQQQQQQQPPMPDTTSQLLAAAQLQRSLGEARNFNHGFFANGGL